MNNHIYIICENKLGGSFKYLKDLIRIYKFKPIFIKNKSELNNINFKEQDYIIVQYLMFTDLSVNDVINVYKKYNFKIIIPIHDFYWMTNKFYGYSSLFHNLYITENFTISNEVDTLFNIADYIICPSSFMYNFIKKYFTKCKNIKLIPHNDYDVNYSNDKYVPKILNKTINIGVFHEFSEYKGKEYYLMLLNHFKDYKEYKLNFLIPGKNIPKYNEHEFFNFIKEYNVHCFTFLNKWGEPYCYTLTKALISGLPIIYNNIGALIDRIPDDPHYFKVFNTEKEMDNHKHLIRHFSDLLNYIILNNGADEKLKKSINNRMIIRSEYNNIFANFLKVNQFTVKKL